MFAKKADTGLAPSPVRYFLQISFATVSVKAFMIYLCRKYITARDLCQGGDLIEIVCDSKALQSNGNFCIVGEIVTLSFRSVYKELHTDHGTGTADNK